jgi:DNA-binding NarL/FixJ family response regulator
MLNAMNEKIAVALVEDEPVTRERLQGLLQASPALELVFSAASKAEILDWLANPSSPKPDVLLVDLGLPDGSGIDVIAQTSRSHPQTDCMVITMFGDEANMIRAFEAGARGYLLKSDNQETLSEHVMQLRQGGSPMSPIIARQLLSRMTIKQPSAPGDPAPPNYSSASEPADNNRRLTAREHEILQYISRGYTYAELSRYLNIGQTTVLTHVRNIYSKLSVHSKTEAVFEARQMGLIK